jgi:signal transduction histidine kinase
MKTVLLIDDDEGILGTFRLALEFHGVRVLTASTGEEGIALARQHLPDLIISDINMPGTDGRGVLQALRADPQLATRQIVLMTGHVGAVTPRTGMNLGADDFLLKPITLEDLTRCVEARLRRADLNWRVEDRVVRELRSTLSSTLPHELFTPLAGILGLTEVLRGDLPNLKAPEIDEILAEIQKSGQRLHRTLRNYLLLLELRKPDTLRRVDTPAAAGDIAGLVAPRIAETLGRHARTGDAAVALAPVALLGDIADIVIIAEELVDNACQFSLRGTPIGVQLTPDGVLAVSDAGRGMTAEQIAQIGAFQQFDRKQHEQQGLGLGLMLARQLAVRCGATFGIRSEAGHGTRTTVAFRVAPAA